MASSAARVGSAGEFGPIVFISHAHEQREWAIEVKERLRLLGFTGFVAHEDIEPGRAWEEEILRNLRACIALVALVSREARDSFWVNQEVGFVTGCEKPTISVGRAIAPWGVLARLQSVPWQTEATGLKSKPAVRELLEANVPRLYRTLATIGVASRRRLIQGLGNTRSFEEARVVVQVLGGLGALEPDEAVRLADVAVANQNVLRCWKAREYLPDLLRPYRDILHVDQITTLTENEMMDGEPP